MVALSGGPDRDPAAPFSRRPERAVRIAAARVTPFRLFLARALRTAHGDVEVREGVLLTLIGDAGLEGYGEATPIAGFGLFFAAFGARFLMPLWIGVVPMVASMLDRKENEK